MSDLDHAKQMRQLATTYHDLGINIVPLGNDKRTVITGVMDNGQPLRFKWDEWQVTRQTEKLFAKIKAPAWWTEVQGIALICGPVSGNLVLVDFDDCTPPPLFWQMLGLTSDYAWGYPTPGNGWHVWMRVDAPLAIDKGKLAHPGADGGMVEIRWTGHYGVAPGSLHPSGGLYQWRNGAELLPPSQVTADTLMAAYWTVAIATPPPAFTTQPPPPHPSTNGQRNYGATALANEVTALRQTQPGGRNEALNKAAFALGQLVAGGELDRNQVEYALLDAARGIGLAENEALSTLRSGMAAGVKAPRTGNHNGNGSTPVYDAGFGPTPTGDAALPQHPAPASQPAAPTSQQNAWPYLARDHRMFYQWESNGETQEKCIADFTASIALDQRSEDGQHWLTLTGHGVRWGAFTCQLAAEDFGSDLKLKALLTAAAGGLDPIYPKMNEHLRPAIARLTVVAERQLRTVYQRTGWRDATYTTFLLPGAESPDALVELPHKLPYGAPAPDGDLSSGLHALAHLCTAIDPQLTTPVLSTLLLAPLHRLAGWRNERTAMFVAGRTGSLKTSWAQTALCLYGAAFANDDQLIKWGEGATRNAIMGLATMAHDLPLLIDNYKPTTGGGKHDFQNLIHNILEGGEKDRMNRAAQLRPTRSIHCLPIITGEDVPDDDAASLARILVVQFEWQRGFVNDALAQAQQDSHQLAAVGWHWLTWLATVQGRTVIKTIASQFYAYRRTWADWLRNHNPDMANILRVATNLAINELTWQIACQCPQLDAVLAPHTAAHHVGLLAIARRMAAATTIALEAHQYLTALQELVQARQYVLVDRAAPGITDGDRDRLVGWFDRDGVYLLPGLALAAVKRLLGPGNLLCSTQTLYNQMQQMGWIAKTGGDVTTRTIAVGSERPRVLHLRPGLLRTVADSTATTVDDDDDIDPDNADDIISQLGI